MSLPEHPLSRPLTRPHDIRADRIGLLLTAAIAAGFSIFMVTYLIVLHRTLGTHAEDMGIMDQVFWNTAHGHFLHQTICNAVSDTNCLGDVSRWAIHFEPLMLVFVPLYWVMPGPVTLLVLQIVGVALGAFPAYWLTSRRFSMPTAGVLGAVAYLSLPTIRSALTSDFHMVTLAAPALMFAIFFLYSRNNVGLLIACIAAMGTKEQVPLDVFMLGLAAVTFQRRWRVGGSLMVLAVCWVGAALVIMHIASPIGRSPIEGRYGDLQVMLQRLSLLYRDPTHRSYVQYLLFNTGGLGVLAPWTLVLALPSALLNALSADPAQYSGIFQYNVDFAPFLWLGMIEGAYVALHWAVCIGTTMRHRLLMQQLVGGLLAGVALFVVFASPLGSSLNPNTLSDWPQVTTHAAEAQRIFATVPPAASVSAQSMLVPHLSERRDIYQFPSGVDVANYLVFDTTADPYPVSPADYAARLAAIFHSGNFLVLNAKDGFLLLQRRAATDQPTPLQFSLTFCPPNSTMQSTCAMIARISEQTV